MDAKYNTSNVKEAKINKLVDDIHVDMQVFDGLAELYIKNDKCDATFVKKDRSKRKMIKISIESLLKDTLSDYHAISDNEVVSYILCEAKLEGFKNTYKRLINAVKSRLAGEISPK